jgi:hypothetical protein
MRLHQPILVFLAGALLFGCGGVEPGTEVQELVSIEQELSACTARAQCGSTSVTCAGNSTCTATDGSGVTCDGVFKPCPVCSYSVSCHDLLGNECLGGGGPCCWDQYNVGSCTCNSRTGTYQCFGL